MNRIRVAVNGYGVIGKRVADAVRLQDDMVLAGVADIVNDYRPISALVVLGMAADVSRAPVCVGARRSRVFKGSQVLPKPLHEISRKHGSELLADDIELQDARFGEEDNEMCDLIREAFYCRGGATDTVEPLGVR